MSRTAAQARGNKWQENGDLEAEQGPSLCVAVPFVTTFAFERLLGCMAPVAILTAPPGFGKTSLLRALSRSVASRGGSVSWRHLDTMFVEDGSKAIDLICIDDAQEADPRKLARLIRTITSSSAAGRRFVIGTRSLPDMDCVSLEAEGRLEILRPEELVLREDEIGKMLAVYSGTVPRPTQVRQICRWTEGWPIAAQWYGMLALRRGGWHQINLDECYPREDLGRYLNEMIYAELDDSMRRFLFDIADLGHFSPDMLREVMDPSCSALLYRVRLENMMIMPASGHADRLKLHGLFQQFLEWKKQQAGVSRNVALLSAASIWSEKRDFFCDAINYALDAGDLDRADALLVRHAEHIVHGLGELPKVLDWTDRLARARKAISPTVALWRIWALILAHEIGTARRELDGLRLDVPADAPPAWRSHIERLHISIIARSDDISPVVGLADEWLLRWDSQDAFHTAAVCVLRALAHHALGGRQAARRDLMIARRHALESGGAYAAIWVAKAEAYIDLQSGRATRARETILTALELAQSSGALAASAVATLHLLAARILVETGDVPRAREHLAAGHLHFGDNGLVETHMAALEAATLLAEDKDGLEAALRETRQRLVHGMRTALHADLLAVRLQLRHDRAKDAEEEFHAAFARSGEGWIHVSSAREVPDWLARQVEATAARIALATGDVEEAAQAVAALLPRAEAMGHVRDQVSLLLLSAACAHAIGRPHESRRGLERAIRIAAEHGFHRTLIDEGWALTALLRECDDLEEGLPENARTLLGTMRSRHGIQVETDADLAPVEALTARESEVLALLDTGLTSQAIAQRMGLGLSTAKWHIQNIYNKLDVRNRSGALARARRLALL